MSTTTGDGAARKGKGRKGKGGVPESILGSNQGFSTSLFPIKPPRKGQAPGRAVMLLTNLFKLSMKQERPIYQYSITIDIEEMKKDGDSKKAEDMVKIPPKLSKDLRRAVIESFVKKWLNENKPSDYPKKLEYSYLFDSNASVIYTLFDMFAKESSDKLEDRIEHKLETITGGKFDFETRFFNVKLHRGSKLDIQKLFDYCNRKGTSDITLVQEQIRALNVIMRGKIITIPINVLTQTSVFPFKQENQFRLSPGVVANKGYFLSVRPTEVGLTLNVANTVAAFHEEIDLIDLLTQRFSVRDLSKQLNYDTIDKLKREIINKQVEARHINYGTKVKPHYRKYRVNDIGGDSLDKFTLVDKQTKKIREITIQEYFKIEYKHNLKYPKLPCIIDKGRKLPIEICHLIEKQRIIRKTSPEETSEMIRNTVMPPERYFKVLEKNVDEIQRLSQPLHDFGLEFDPKPIEVEGRELPPISLVGGMKKDISPMDGQYNVQSDRFYKPVVVRKWILAFIVDPQVQQDKQRNAINENKFSDLYCAGGRQKGVNIPPVFKVEPIQIMNMDDQQIKATLKKYFLYLNKNKVDHAIIVLPRRCPDWTYRYLQFLETSAQEGRAPGESWTRTSCLKYENYMNKIINGRDGGKMFISNLWLKYNTKLGGINFVLKDDKSNEFLQDGYIFISVDVCHPAPGDKLIQSVAAVVGMWDLTNPNMSYSTALRVQKKQRENHSTIEHVGEIDQMVDKVLDSYVAKKKKLPTKIVILRDGVSEGQFKIVLEYELKLVKNLLHKKYTNAKLQMPPLSCLVVQKRHKVRFVRKVAYQSRRGPDYNIQPGTVVDSKITHPTDFSFYLAPHKAIQGTSRAAHIYMICDEIKFSQDQAQAMVHALSYLSPRCTKSTSIPTPVNLADLAAERGKNIVISWNDDNRHKMKEEERLVKLNDHLSKLADANYKNTLYYV